MTRTFRLCLGMMCMVWAGCQTYRPSPLCLATHLRNWVAMDVAGPEVQRYCQGILAVLYGPGVRMNVADGLDLLEAEAVALYFNPSLRLARAEAHVPLASARKAGLWDDPFFGAVPLYATGTGPDTPWVLPGVVGITIPLSGRLEVERERAWAEYSAAWREVAIAEWELLSELRSVWLNLAAKQREIALVEEYVKRIAPFRESAEKLITVGELLPTQGRLLDISERSRTAELVRLRGQAEVLRLRLLDLMGLKPACVAALHPVLCTFEEYIPPTHWACELLRRHPRMALLQAEYKVAEKTLHREIRRQHPDIIIGPAYEFDEGQSRIGFGLGLPVPAWNRNQQGIAEASAARDAAAQRAHAELQRLVSQATRAQVARDTARAEAECLRTAVSPLVERQMAESITLIKLGESDLPLLLGALNGWLDHRLAILRADLAEAQAANVLYTMLHPQWIAGKACPARGDNCRPGK